MTTEEVREIRPLLHYPGEAEPIRPDDIPKAPGANDQLPRTSLVLYVYRVPGSKDLFLTQHKIPNDHPTSTDVNGASYYIRYDNWPGPTRNYTQSAFTESSSLGSVSSELEWRNSSQKCLDERGFIGPRGSKMSLVAVNMSRDDIREVATLVDPKVPGRIYRFNSRTQPPSVDQINAENPLFLDLHPEAYKHFGLDLAYWQGKAFTRRIFRADAFKPHYSFTSPWGGQVTLERFAHGKPTLKGFHRMPNRASFEGILSSELRPNFSPYRRSYERSQSTTDARPALSINHRDSFDSTMSSAAQSRLTNHREKLNRLRHRSEIISGSAKEKLNVMLNSRNSSFDSGFRYKSSESSFHLAQEPLGGGTGDEAKLAKLIIYPEGQDFIDLIIAANMLVFHSIYERAMPWLHSS